MIGKMKIEYNLSPNNDTHTNLAYVGKSSSFTVDSRRKLVKLAKYSSGPQTYSSETLCSHRSDVAIVVRLESFPFFCLNLSQFTLSKLTRHFSR